MSEAKYTPGPWVVDSELKKDSNMCSIPYFEVSSSKEIIWIAQVAQGSFTSIETAQANASLIAAAPELLEALQEIMRFEHVIRDYAAPALQYPDNLLKSMEAVKAAIKKALNQ